MKAFSLLAAASLALTILSAIPTLPANAQEIVWQAVEPIEDLKAYAAERRAARGLASKIAQSPVDKNSVPGSLFYLPAYTVDTLDPGGLTTVIAIRNTVDELEGVTFRYFDTEGVLLGDAVSIIGSQGIIPVNLRDIPAVVANVDPDGFARGFMTISAPSPILTGDYFQVDPAQNFATGGRLIGRSEFCNQWGIRFLNGGVFTGGTDYQMFIDEPLGSNRDEVEPSVIVNVRNENGIPLGSFAGWTDNKSFRFTVADLVGPETTSGSFDFFIDDSVGIGGYVTGEFSANGRFSVGVDGVCVPDEQM